MSHRRVHFRGKVEIHPTFRIRKFRFGNAGLTIFEKDEDYGAFERVLAEAVERTKTRLLAYCVMPSHWHLVVWPQAEGELSDFVGWLTLTHTQRWHAHRHTAGAGHVYQGRFQSFPVQEDEHFYTICRDVEPNALRVNLVAQADQWRWSSLSRWLTGNPARKSLLTAWPTPGRPQWVDHVNTSQTEDELAALHRCVQRGCP